MTKHHHIKISLLLLFLLVPPCLGNFEITINTTVAGTNLTGIESLDVSSSAIYISSTNGHRMKIGLDGTVHWAKLYLGEGWAMKLSPDDTFLLAGGFSSTT